MKKCPLCGEYQSSQYNFCPIDGGELVSLDAICPNCSKSVYLDEKFCGNCGNKLEFKEFSEEEQAALNDEWTRENEATGN